MSTAPLLRRLLLLLCVAALLAPLTGTASAAPRLTAPSAVAAHQDDGADDDAVDDAGWGDEDDALDDDPAADDDPSLSDADDPADPADGADAADATDDGWDLEDPADDGGWDGVVDDPAQPAVEYVTGRAVAGKVAGLRRDGRAAIPRGAPARVRRLIAAANRIVGKPYKWGGGHARTNDRGYDCSGTVSYALMHVGLLDRPLDSRGFAKWGRAEAGRWVTIYANRGHVYMEVAGLRLDTSAMGDPAGGKGPRWRPAIGWRRGFHVRHVAGL